MARPNTVRPAPPGVNPEATTDLERLIDELQRLGRSSDELWREALRELTPEEFADARKEMNDFLRRAREALDDIDDPALRERLRDIIDNHQRLWDDKQHRRHALPATSTPPGDTPDSPGEPRQPGDIPEPPPTEAPDQPTPPGDLPDPDTSPDPGPDEPTPPGDTPNPDNGPTAPGNTPPSPPKPDTPQTPDTPDTPETPGEPSTPGEVPDHTPPDWWQPTTPPDPDTPDFRHPPEPDYAQPPTDQADLGRMLADWLSAIIAAITPPTPVEPEGDDGHTFSEEKEDSWQQYLDNNPSPEDRVSRSDWSRLYDQLGQNRDNGTEFDRLVGEVMGYTPDNGWVPQYRNPNIAPGRIWDYANPSLRELVENKSGRLDREQLRQDEQALKNGWSVTYNLSKPLSPSDNAQLERLENQYDGLFHYHWVVP